MITTTRWRPDTCDCVVEYEWDTESSQETRTHTPKNVTKCEAHSNTANLTAHWNVLNEENPRKNKIMERLKVFSELVDTNPDGSTTIRGHLVSWRFNAQRALELTITGLSAQKKAQAQTWADNNLGVGKVIIL